MNTLLCDPRFGMVWLIRIGQTAVGYIAVCFCYSIEFGGTDSFIDEFFIDEEYRERGLGTMAIEHIVQELRQEGIRAVSLEVANLNNGAKRLYSRCGFTPRDRYSLMTKRL